MTNPTLEFAESLVVPPEVEFLTSRGGGSTIDVGKWLARKYKLRHHAIPTTAGTGSEVTKYCVLMVNGKKKTYDLDVPDSFTLDPALVVTLPQTQTISTGFDALCQSLESYWSKNATVESRSYSSAALELIKKSMFKSAEDLNDQGARMDMLYAANLSGKAINITRTNVCHAISYPITELYGIPHGIACSLSLVYFTRKALNLDFAPFLSQFIIKRGEIDPKKIAKIAIKSQKLKDCPFEITKEDIIKSLS